MSRSKEDAYADILIVILSLAAVKHGHERTPVAAFLGLMTGLRKEFPNDLPSFDVVGRPPFQSSNLLLDALHRALHATPPKITTDDRGHLLVDRATAARNLNSFDDFTRKRHVRIFSEIANRFVALQRATDDGPTPVTPDDVA